MLFNSARDQSKFVCLAQAAHEYKIEKVSHVQPKQERLL
jgi:hypothetical protein